MANSGILDGGRVVVFQRLRQKLSGGMVVSGWRRSKTHPPFQSPQTPTVSYRTREQKPSAARHRPERDQAADPAKRKLPLVSRSEKGWNRIRHREFCRYRFRLSGQRCNGVSVRRTDALYFVWRSIHWPAFCSGHLCCRGTLLRCKGRVGSGRGEVIAHRFHKIPAHFCSSEADGS